jgi:hypothetical protein
MEALARWRQVHRDRRNVVLIIANPRIRLPKEPLDLDVGQVQSIGASVSL